MPKFAVHIKRSNGQRERVIEEAPLPEEASNKVRARIREEGGAALVLKVKAISDENTRISNV